jgi:hypothetical protein
MGTVIDYVALTTTDFEYLYYKIDNLIKDGWQRFGGITVSRAAYLENSKPALKETCPKQRSTFTQVMVKVGK